MGIKVGLILLVLSVEIFRSHTVSVNYAMLAGWLLVSMYYLTFSLFVTVISGGDFGQGVLSIIYMCLVLVLSICFGRAFFRPYGQAILHAIFVCLVLYATLKVSIVVLSLVGAVPASALISFIEGIMPGVVFQKFDGSNYLRFATSSDVISVYFISFYILGGFPFRVSKALFFAALIATAANIVLSGTRALILFFLICLVIKAFMLLRRQSKLILSFVPLAIFGSALGFDLVSGFLRSGSAFATRLLDWHSLKIKLEQSIFLVKSISESPFLGRGAGSPAIIDGSKYLRHSEFQFVYENQWLAVINQFGLLGFLIFCAPIYTIAAQLVRGRKVDFVFVPFLIFLITGFTNPNLTIISSSLIFATFGLIFYRKSIKFPIMAQR